jgi:predicted ArsR family transcriptional regulator
VVVAELTDSKRRLVERLKRVESATAPELAAEFGITDTAARQHLEALEAAGLVERFAATSEGRGRPPTHWKLTALAADLFPDRHGELTVELIAAIRDALGEDGLAAVIASRSNRQLDSYRRAIPAGSSVAVRVGRLAEVRSSEGYLAEAVADGANTLLIEHHCPINDAASSCQGLCAAELELFRTTLGNDVEVTRVSHLLSGDTRCAYRITPKQ